MANNEENENPSPEPQAAPTGWKGRWQKLWRRPQAWYLFGIPLGGFAMFALGIILWGGFNTAMEMSSTLTFCTSCHEMSWVYEEYKQTVHYKNASGVRATCPDCHVPKPWGAKVLRKIGATFNEVPNAILGTINTKEKFEAHRLELAKNVWAVMRSNDSRECRNCHSFDAMDLEEQGRSAQRRHSRERKGEDDKTCIDCHEGIAHHLPDDY